MRLFMLCRHWRWQWSGVSEWQWLLHCRGSLTAGAGGSVSQRGTHVFIFGSLGLALIAIAIVSVVALGALVV